MPIKSAFVTAATLDQKSTTFHANDGRTGKDCPAGTMRGAVEFDAANGPLAKGDKLDRDPNTGPGFWIRSADFR